MRAGRIVVVVIGALGALAATYACSTFQGETTDPDGGGAAETGGDVATSDAPLEAGPPPPGPSCKEILAKHPERAGRDGLYPLAPAGDGGQKEIYCDMTIEGGGWTLVGRSAPGAASTEFGWNKKTGELGDPEFPYSLDVISLGIIFEQVLVAERSPTGAVGETAFRFKVKPDFTTRRNNSVDVRPAVYVRGPCNPEGGPEMLRYAGATGFNNNFFLRDIDNPDTRNGLDPNGFDLVYSSCERGGLLDKKQGVILVR